MRFLVDECATARTLIEALRVGGHDVLLVREVAPQARDEDVLKLAQEEGRILLTLDKDFGELAFVRRMPHPAIVRFVELTVEQQVAALAELMRDYSHALSTQSIIVVSVARIRIRVREQP